MATVMALEHRWAGFSENGSESAPPVGAFGQTPWKRSGLPGMTPRAVLSEGRGDTWFGRTAHGRAEISARARPGQDYLVRRTRESRCGSDDPAAAVRACSSATVGCCWRYGRKKGLKCRKSSRLQSRVQDKA